MLDRRAAIPDDTQPQRLGAPRCGLVPEVELEPHRGYPRREGVVDDRIQEFAPAKDVAKSTRVSRGISASRSYACSPSTTARSSRGFTGITRKP